MRSLQHVLLALTLLGGSLLVSLPSDAQSWGEGEVVGSLVTVSLEVDGTSAPLYAAPDGSGRYYLEAREGAHYSVHVANRTPERIAVMLTVDGLNAISGERQGAPRLWGRSRPGRMYVLNPWERTTVNGWRTSLEDVRRFTFVDERASYAARSGKANAKMGWIEVTVYRERTRDARPRAQEDRVTPPRERGRERNQGRDARHDGRDSERDDERESAARGAQPEPASPATPDAARQKSEAAEGPENLGDLAGGGRRSFPGTGWGPRAEDRAVVVNFEPERKAAERITLRYEYAEALLALGVELQPRYGWDRLAERERGSVGFAQPPSR